MTPGCNGYGQSFQAQGCLSFLQKVHFSFKIIKHNSAILCTWVMLFFYHTTGLLIVSLNAYLPLTVTEETSKLKVYPRSKIPSNQTSNQAPIINITHSSSTINSAAVRYYIIFSIHLPQLSMEQLFSMAAEETTDKQWNYQEISCEYEKIKSCLGRFPQLEQRVGGIQLTSIQLKYQYFLRKFQKYTDEHQKYREMFKNIPNTVEESSQIMQENRSIEFIKKVMEQTQKKYNVLKSDIDGLKAEKEKTKHHMLRLKNTLLNIKKRYFQLERTEAELSDELAKQTEWKKRSQIHKTMFKIRVQKQGRRDDGHKIKNISLITLNQNSFVAQHKMTEQLDLINRIKEQFLDAIGINIDEFYKLNERGYSLQSKYNRQMLKKEIEAQSKISIRSAQNYDLEEHGVQVFKVVQSHDEQLKRFMRVSSEQVIDMIVKKNKVGEMLNLIEGEKGRIIEEYREGRKYR